MLDFISLFGWWVNLFCWNVVEMVVDNFFRFFCFVDEGVI